MEKNEELVPCMVDRHLYLMVTQEEFDELTDARLRLHLAQLNYCNIKDPIIAKRT
jgi:hypothetical protein